MNKIENGIANLDAKIENTISGFYSVICGYARFTGTLSSGNPADKYLVIRDPSVKMDSIIIVSAQTQSAIIATPALQTVGSFNIYIYSINADYTYTDSKYLPINYIIANPPT
jgi:hypothetical protein